MRKRSAVDFKCLAVAFGLFVLSGPFFFWGILSSNIIVFFIEIPIGIFFLRHRKKLTSVDKKLIVLFLATWFFYFFLNVVRHGYSVPGLIAQLPYCLYFGVFFLEELFLSRIGRYFINIVLLFAVIGAFFFLFFPNLTFGSIEHYVQDRAYSIHPFFIHEDTVYDDIIGIKRFYGPYDEPGILGTMLAFFIPMLRCNFRDIRVWACIIIGGLTFSFFFYVTFALYWAFKSFSFKKSVLIMSLAIMAFGGFYFMTKDNPIMYEIIWHRFEWDSSEGKIKGDDRMKEFGEIEYQKLKGTKDYWLGLDSQKAQLFWKNADGSSSYKMVVAAYGIIFFVAYTAFFLLFGWFYKGEWFDYLFYVTFVLLCFYQRTNVYSIEYIFMYAYISRLKDLLPEGPRLQIQKRPT